MADKKCFLWSELAEEWIGAYYIWSDVCIAIKVKQALSGGGGGIVLTDQSAVQKLKQQLDPVEYKRFIEIVCKVNGLTFRQIKERKENGLPEITMVEIKRAVQSITRPNVTVKRISREDI